MPLCEAHTGATPAEVAAPAVRPPHRGRRSREARCRRFLHWHSHVSQCLVSLMPRTPFVTSLSHLSDPTEIAVVAAVASAAAAAAAAAAPAASASAFAAADDPGTGNNFSVGQVSAETVIARNGDGRLEANSTLSVNSKFKLFHLNPRGLGCNMGEVSALVDSLGRPQIVGFTETHSQRTHERLSGYHLVSQLDRRTGEQGGGIALFALNGFEQSVAHLADSKEDERAWFIIHADSGPILLCLWYRRPDNSEVESIRRFDVELSKYSHHAVSCIIMGDMNCHNPDWLHFSRRSTPEGRELEEVSCAHGLRQLVKEPTRGPYLLDLVLSDLASGIRCRVVPGIHGTDHDGVLITVNLDIAVSEPVERTVYDFKHADWPLLKKLLLETNWRTTLAHNGNEAAQSMVEKILVAVTAAIPRRVMLEKVFAHPWLDDACRIALDRKRSAFGTPLFELRRDECSRAFLAAYESYVARTRAKLKELPPSSRGWWKLSSTLLQRGGEKENIPPLKREDDSWALTAEERARELARVFRSKSCLPEVTENEYTELIPTTRARMLRLPRLSVGTTHDLLRNIDETSGTGPDLLPARVLKACAAELALPVTLLVRMLLREHCWPECWRLHWVHPLHKKGPKADSNNYRGVHLTPQLSKVVERAVGSLFLPWLEETGGFGPSQYAYTKRRGYKDVLAVNTCTWLLLMEEGFAVGLFCSDVKGAFDRVSAGRLTAKLTKTGLHADVVGFLASWLSDRTSKVVVGGRASGAEPLTDSVFQGTVLGPPLWNGFFADSIRPLVKKGFASTAFADDLNAWKAFRVDRASATPLERLLMELREVQTELHTWGASNQVIFDPVKESFHVLHRTFHHGDCFKILGCIYDPQLRMLTAARHIATEASWRLKTLLRTRRFFTDPELMRLYKAQILSYLESSTAAVYHASPSTLAWIDRVQVRFLREIGITELAALQDYRLAPLPSRRDIGMLGVLHKINLNTAVPQLQTLFPIVGSVVEPAGRQRLRHWRRLHSKQLATPVDFSSSDVLKRSLFGLVHCYNGLPQKVVDARSVKAFQQQLQSGLLKYAELGAEDWHFLYSRKWKQLPRARRDILFEL